MKLQNRYNDDILDVNSFDVLKKNGATGMVTLCAMECFKTMKKQLTIRFLGKHSPRVHHDRMSEKNKVFKILHLGEKPKKMAESFEKFEYSEIVRRIYFDGI